jgi:hypothetical protein
MKKNNRKPLELSTHLVRPLVQALDTKDLKAIAGGSGATVCYRISVGFCD